MTTGIHHVMPFPWLSYQDAMANQGNGTFPDATRRVTVSTVVVVVGRPIDVMSMTSGSSSTSISGDGQQVYYPLGAS